MDVVDLLTADHNRMKGMFVQFKAAHDGDDKAQMLDVVARMIEDLRAHEKVEERIFYPRIEGDTEKLHAEVAEGLEEHHVCDLIVAEIEKLDSDDEQWPFKVKVLIESLEHHMKEEEEGMFVNVRKSRPAADLEELCEQVEELKDELGAPSPADAAGLTKTQLIDLASEQEIPGRSKMSIDELAATVDARDLADSTQ